jgi:hypothetical protein
VKVYNLTQKQLEFHGFSIPPNGGWREVPAMDVFVSDRDLEMCKRGVISFTNTPPGWRPSGEVKVTIPSKPPQRSPKPVSAPAVFAVPELEKTDEKKSKQDKWKKSE